MHVTGCRFHARIQTTITLQKIYDEQNPQQTNLKPNCSVQCHSIFIRGSLRPSVTHLIQDSKLITFT